MRKKPARFAPGKRIGTEIECHRRLERLRWPRGLQCPSCGASRISRFQARGKTGKKRRLYTCLACRYQFTVTAGTFLHDSHLPLKKWFEAIFALCSAPYRTVRGSAPNLLSGGSRGSAPYQTVRGSAPKRTLRGPLRPGWVGRPLRRRLGSWETPPPKRMSARRLQSQLKLGSYKTAWLLARRIRRAREHADPLLAQIARLPGLRIRVKGPR